MFKGDNLPSDEKEQSLLDEQVECLPPPGDDLPYDDHPIGTVLEQPQSIQASAMGFQLICYPIKIFNLSDFLMKILLRK